jgi:DNA-binding transcriptional ArsR family regulator
MGGTRKRAFKSQLFGQFARIGKALASGRRLELLELLAQGERTVEVLAPETGMSVANTSLHLKALREARLVDVRRPHWRTVGSKEGSGYGLAVRLALDCAR